MRGKGGERRRKEGGKGERGAERGVFSKKRAKGGKGGCNQFR